LLSCFPPSRTLLYREYRRVFTKRRLQLPCAALDLASLYHEIFLCQEQLDKITKRRQLIVIKIRSSYTTISGSKELSDKIAHGASVDCNAFIDGVNNQVGGIDSRQRDPKIGASGGKKTPIHRAEHNRNKLS
jgi:hypothetical protein